MSPTACACAGGVTDSFAGLPLPQDLILNAIVLSKRPNADGRGFEPTDVVSDSSTPVRFVQIRRALQNAEPVRLHLLKGAWRCLYLLFLHEDGTPFAKGLISTGPLASGQVLEASPDLITISSRARN